MHMSCLQPSAAGTGGSVSRVRDVNDRREHESIDDDDDDDDRSMHR